MSPSTDPFHFKHFPYPLSNEFMVREFGSGAVQLPSGLSVVVFFPTEDFSVVEVTVRWVEECRARKTTTTETGHLKYGHQAMVGVGTPSHGGGWGVGSEYTRPWWSKI